MRLSGRMLASVTVLSLCACSNKISTKDASSYAASVVKVQEDLSSEKKAAFHDAMVAIAFDTAVPSESMFSNADLTSPLFLGATDKIKGKTADQIIKQGYDVRIGLLDKDIAKDAAAIQSAKAARQKLANVFDNIHITNARYYIDHSNQFMDQPIIAFHIANGSKMPIKTIYAHGTLSSPGRSIPWIDADFNYDFDGGLEPGEEQSLNLEPNAFGDWSAKDNFSNRSDIVLKLGITNLEGANGQKLINEDQMDLSGIEKDAAEKQKLRQKLASEQAKLS